MQTKIIRISNVMADENQPRKNFSEIEMARLKASVKKYGIKQPITVEDMGNGKYLLIDGERRYRAAKSLGIDEVTAIIEKPHNKLDRIVEQFHIQELHEGWTPTEKAMVVNELAEEMGIPITDVCSLLGILPNTGRRYLAFSKIINKDAFQRTNINVEWAMGIGNIKKKVQKIYEDNNERFDKTTEKKIELAIIRRISDGTISKRSEISKIKDAFTSDAKSIKKFLETEVTPQSLFVDSNANEAYHLRNIDNGLRFLGTLTTKYLEMKHEIKPDEKLVSRVRTLKNQLEKLISSLE